MENPEGEELKTRLEFSEYKRALLQKRLSRGGIEEDSTLWSFVDLMTLLLILFILFYSHAVTHKGSARYKASKQSQTAEAPPIVVHKTSMNTEPAAYAPHQPKPEEIKTLEENPDETLEQFEKQVLETVSEKVKKDFSVHWNQKRLVLVLGERIAFNVGEADLLSDFQPTLKQIAEFISSQKEYNVTIAGHTDDTPINNTQFPSNWELSAIRAVNVAKFMISNGVNPHSISTEGYSAYRPLQPNTSDDNRHANRRVEITLIKEHEKEKPTDQMNSDSALNASPNPTPTPNIPAYPKKSYHTARGYLF
jgi:chemotaxis protein MotB